MNIETEQDGDGFVPVGISLCRRCGKKSLSWNPDCTWCGRSFDDATQEVETKGAA